MRLFLAIELSEPVREHLDRITRDWREHWDEYLIKYGRARQPQPNWVRSENLHLTLKFLGQVTDAEIAPLITALKSVAMESAITLRTSQIEFLSGHSPRVIAAGVAGDMARVEILHRGIDEACGSCGIATEARAYRPHVTLARCRAPLPSVARNMDRRWEGRFPGPVWETREFVLFESRLSENGARYLPLARISSRT